MCHQEAAVQRTFQLERSSLSSSLMVRTRQSSSLLVLCTQLFLASYPGSSPTKSMSMRLSYTAHRLQLSTSRSEKTLYDLVQECIRTEWKLSSWHMSHYCQGFRRRGGVGNLPSVHLWNLHLHHHSNRNSVYLFLQESTVLQFSDKGSMAEWAGANVCFKARTWLDKLRVS